MLEQPLRVARRLQLLAARRLALAHVLDGDQHAGPVVLEAGQHAAGHLDVDAAPAKAVIDRDVGEFEPPFPELDHLLAMGIHHVVAEHGGKVGGQVLEIARLEQRMGAGVDFEDADGGGALVHLLRLVAEQRPEIGDPLGAPAPEQRLELAVILEPQRHGRELEAGLRDIRCRCCELRP